MMQTNAILCGDARETLKTLPDACVQMVCTSPPYWHLRDYRVAGQLGLEPSYDEYVTKLCDVFDEVKRVLRADGTCWVNLADSYGGDGCKQKQPHILHKKMLRAGIVMPGVPRSDIPRKSLCLIPFRFAIEMVRRGWILRNVLIWKKCNAVPESMKDRFTIDFEYLFFFSKSPRYYFNQQFEPTVSGNGTRNKRTVWEPSTASSILSVNTQPFSGNHFAAYPEKLVETPIKAGSPEGGLVLDPFAGTCTTGVVCKKLGRKWLGIELNPAYCAMARARLDSS
jgi:site-specific DNA-methyltransferase (cytosine-N4-specific)